MKLTLNFKELGKGDAMIAGGKGASLGEMTKAGIPVPPGFVVLSTTFDQFIQDADLAQEIHAILDVVNHKDINSVEQASEKIQALIKDAEMPAGIAKEIKSKFKELDTEFVAVRSSATAEDGADNAWAGQLDSFLNTKEANLLEKVQHCWASLFTPRAIFYRFEKGLHATKISVAVVVQKMVNSEVSGIAFSVHPVTEDRNQLIIEAGFGLGEAIVSGQVTPDSYVVEKVPRRIIDTNVSTQTRGLYRVKTGGNEWIDIPEPKASSQVLSEAQVLEFANLIMKIENHYGFPCDIEWAFEKGRFYIVQSRPITTLKDKTGDKVMPSGTSEEVPVKKNEINKDNAFDWAKNFLKSNSLDIKEAKCAFMITEFLFKSFAEKNCFGESYSPVFVPYQKTIAMQIISVERMNGSERKNWQIFLNDKKRFLGALKDADQIQKKMDSISIGLDKLKSLSDSKLTEYILKLSNLILSWWKYGSIGEDKGLIVEEKIVPMLMKKYGFSPDEARDYVMTMTVPEEKSIFSKERVAFLEMCLKVLKNNALLEALKTGEIFKSKRYFLFVETMHSYSKNYFYSRSDFYSAKNLNDENLSKIIVNYCLTTSVSKTNEEIGHIYDNYKELLKNKKQFAKKIKLLEDEKGYLDYFSTVQGWQDTRKVSMLKHFSYLFYALEEVGNRKNIPYEVITLFKIKEIMDFLSGADIDLQEIRKREEASFSIFKDGKPTDFFVGEQAIELKKTIYGDNKESTILGTIACKGKNSGQKISGKVRVVFDPSNDEFNEGEILVTSMTRPEFVPIMKRALAIITDEGGIACHAAIVSRELGVPCIIGTKTASKILKSGDTVEVDADKGIVTIFKNDKKNEINRIVDEKNNIILKEGRPDLSKFTVSKIIRRTNSPLYNSFMRVGATIGNSEIEFDSRMKTSIVLDNDIYYIEEEFTDLKKRMVEPMKKDPTFLERYLDKSYKDSMDLINWSKKQNGSKDFLKTYNEFTNRSLKVMSHLWPCLGPEDWILSEIEKVLAKKIDPKKDFGEYKRVLTLLIASTDLSEITLKKIGMLEGKNLRKAHEEYAWVNDQGLYFDYELFESFKKELAGIKNPKQELKRINGELKELKSSRAQIIKKYKIDKNTLNLCELAQRLPHIRLIRRNCVIQAAYNMRDFFSRLQKELPLSKINYAYYWELRDLLQGMEVDIEKIEKRKETYNFIVYGNEFYDYDKETGAKIKQEIESTFSNSNEVKGQTACVGKVSGVARVLFSSKELGGQKIYSPIYNVSLFVEGATWNCYKYFNEFYDDPEPHPVFIMCRGDEGVAVIPADLLNTISRQTFLKYWKNPKLLDEVDEYYKKGEKQINDYYEKCSYKYVSENSIEKLLKELEEIKDITFYTHARVLFSAIFDEDFCKERLDELGIKYDRKIISEVYSRAGIPITESFDKRRLIDYLCLLQSKISEEKLLERTQYYPVGHSMVLRPEKIKEYLEKTYGNIDGDSISDRLAEMRKEREERRENINQLLGSVSEDYKKIINYIQFIIEKRDIRKDLIGKYFTIVFRICEKIFNEAGISPEYIFRIAYDDLKKGPEYLKNNSALIIERAKNCSVLIYPDGRAEYEMGSFEENRKNIDELYLSQQENTSEDDKNIIFGKTGSSGKVTGIVKIVRNIELDGGKFNDGDILVTGMTRPDFIPLMNKASAFITDEGGVTCHAAIVAREMKKPAVIGTKIGTHKLKDGDLVEVNADKGIVRIINPIKS